MAIPLSVDFLQKGSSGTSSHLAFEQDSVIVGQLIAGHLGVSLAVRFNFQTIRYSECVFLKLVVMHTTQLVVNPTLLSLHCAMKRR